METMERPTKLIVDCSTGEQTVVPLTDEEIAEREALAAQGEAFKAAEEAAATAKAEALVSARTKLAALGLTETEIDAMVGA